MMIRNLLLFLGAACAILFAGCSKEADAPPLPTATIENLKVAHACAVKRSLWYDAAANEADLERMGNLALLFRAISRSEAIHASLHEQLLASKGQATDTSKASCPPLGNTRQAMKMALSLERTEYEGLYPPMVSTAKREGWIEAMEQLSRTGSADSGHMTLMREASERSGTVPIRQYHICTSCGAVTVNADSSCTICGGGVFETQ